MRVTIKTWRGKRETFLADALRPQSYYERSGVAEDAAALAQATAEAFGRLAELLVDKGVITLEEAVSVAGVTHEVERVD